MNREYDTTDLTNLIAEKMHELTIARTDTWAWVAKEHTIKDTEARIKEFQIVRDEISKLALEIATNRSVSDKVMEANRWAMNIIHGYESDIEDCLNRDWDAKKKSASENKFDFVKNTTLIFGLPAVFVSSVKNGVGNGRIDINEAMLAGFAISIPTVFHKTVVSLFSNVAKNVCALPSSVSNDTRVLYLQGVIHEKRKKTQAYFTCVARSFDNNVRPVCSKIESRTKRFFGRGGPNV